MESKDMNKFITFLLFFCRVLLINARGITWTFGNYQYIYTGESKSWRNAKLDCARRGARLATVDSRAISDSLANNLKNEVWIGGYRDRRGSNWKWIDGTDLSWNNWDRDEPGTSNENCILVKQHKEKKWNNYYCHVATGVLCEKGAVHNVTVNRNVREVIANQRFSVTCKADGAPTPDVTWMRGQTTVSERKTSGIYQTKTPGKSTLYHNSAILSDEAEYTCCATNEIDGKGRTLRKQLKVPSPPSLVRVGLIDCSFKARVTWKPHLRALHHWHNITVTNIRNNGDSYNNLQVAKDSKTQMKTEFQLKPKTSYRVAVIPCRSKTDCVEKYAGQQTGFTTRVLSGSVKGVHLSQSPPYTCVATWNELAQLIAGQQMKYKIIINESLSYIPRGSSTVDGDKQLYNTTSQESYHFKGKPNRKYGIGVQAETCNVLGNISWCEDICVTDPKAPETLSKPQISKGIIRQGTLNVKIDIPSEENGEISCLFVIVRVDDTEKRMESNVYNMADLIRANSSKDEYIAVSQKMITKQQLELTLGDGGQSECYASSATSKRQKREANDQLFVGRNLILNQTKNHSIFIVSLSPAISGFLVKRGEIAEVMETPIKDSLVTDANSISTVIGGAAGGVLFLILLAIIAVVIYKSRSRTKPSDDQEEPQYAGIENELFENNAPPVADLDANPYDLADDADAAAYQSFGNVSVTTKRTNTDIQMINFEKVYTSMQKNNDAEFAQQFKELIRRSKNLTLTMEFAANPLLKSKNRYKNILPFDDTRVPIEHNEDGYINACFIDGFEMKHKFIATQGPLKKTVNDFWLMVVEQKCSEIVMLAKCIEGGKTKCEKYWPDLGDTIAFGQVKVSNLNEVPSCGFTCRSLKVSSQMQSGKVEMIVSQYHFLRWPDHGFPITTSYILQMHQKCMEARQKNQSNSPIVVHCSAGAGRTGTFIGYDIVLNESKSVGNADVFECVAKMRSQRMEMVQNCDQYILVHKLLLESHLFGITDVHGRNIAETFTASQYNSKVAVKQFKDVSRVPPMAMSQNHSDKKISTYERMRVMLYEDGRDILKSLEASFIETYDGSSTAIVSREPTRSNLDAFWKLILQDQVSVIVMVTENTNKSFEYWNERCNATVTIEREEIIKAITIRKLRICGILDVQKTVTHIHLQLSPKDTVVEKVIKLNDSVSRTQSELRETEGIVLVHCKNGIGMSGVFCAIMNLLERLKVEDRVDVFRSVKDLRDCKEGMVSTMEQFQFCHQSVLQYLQNFDTYSNFK